MESEKSMPVRPMITQMPMRPAKTLAHKTGAHFFVENEDRKRGDKNRRHPHNGGKIDERHYLERQHAEQSRAKEKHRPQHLQDRPARDHEPRIAPGKENGHQNHVNKIAREGDFRRGIGSQQDAREGILADEKAGRGQHPKDAGPRRRADRRRRRAGKGDLGGGQWIAV